MDAVDGSSELQNRVKDTNALSKNAGNFTKWILQFYVSQTSEHFGTACSNDFCAVLDYDVTKENEINNAGVTNRETIVTKMIFDGLVSLALLSFVLQSFDPKLMFTYLTYYVFPEIDEKKNYYQRINEQFVECVKFGVHESFINGVEIVELLKDMSSEYGDKMIGSKEYNIYTKDKNDYEETYEQRVECKELGFHEKFIDFIDGAVNTELMKGKPSEYGDGLINLKECIIYTQEGQNQSEIDCTTDEFVTSECLKLVKDIVGSKDPLLNNFIGYNSDAQAGAAGAIAIVHRENYKPYMYAGGARDPETKIFETKSQTVMSNFPIFRALGMVGWQNANFDKQKHEKKQKTRFSAFSAAAARSHSAQTQRGDAR